MRCESSYRFCLYIDIYFDMFQIIQAMKLMGMAEFNPKIM